MIVRLTSGLTGESEWVNMDSARSFSFAKESGTIICWNDGSHEHYMETPEQIMDMLGDTEVVRQYKQVLDDAFDNMAYNRGKADAVAGEPRQLRSVKPEYQNEYDDGYKEGLECVRRMHDDTT